MFIFEEHRTFRGFTDLQRLLAKNQYIEMLKRSKFQAKLPLS